MTRLQFKVQFSGEVVIELDDAVIDVVDDEWRKSFYDLHTPEQIAEHIAYNFVANRAELSELDGWADQPNSNALQIGNVDWDDWEAREK